MRGRAPAIIVLAVNLLLVLHCSRSHADETVRRADERPVLLEVGAGAGVGSRVIELPSRAGMRRLATGMFPALQLGLHAAGVVRRHWLLGVRVGYQTSVGLDASELASLANPPRERTPLRVSSIDFGVEPGYRFGTTPASGTVSLFLGWGIRGLHAVTEIGVPNYMLNGPVVRPVLQIPIGHGAVALRIAPELFAIVAQSGALRDLASTSRYGVAWGGEAAIDVRVWAPVHLEMNYRESHVGLDTQWPRALSDVERYAALQVRLQY